MAPHASDKFVLVDSFVFFGIPTASVRAVLLVGEVGIEDRGIMRLRRGKEVSLSFWNDAKAYLTTNLSFI